MAEFGDRTLVSAVTNYALDISPDHPVFVTWAGENHVQLCTDPTTTSVAGIATTDAKSGNHVTVCTAGKTKIVAGGAVAANAAITSNASGRATSTIGSGDFALGICLEASAADGDIVTCLLNPPGYRTIG